MAGELDRDSESSRLHYNLLVYSALQDAPVTTRQWETPLVPGAKHRDVLSGQPILIGYVPAQSAMGSGMESAGSEVGRRRTSSVDVGGLGCDIPSPHFPLKLMQWC